MEVEQNLDVLYQELIPRICEGDIHSFLSARRFFEDIDFLSIVQTVAKEDISYLYNAKNFISDVLSNLGGDTMFGFPSNWSYIGGQFSLIVRSIGEFLKFALLEKNQSRLNAYDHFDNAINLYYGLLRELNEHAKDSDLSDLEQFRPKRS